MLTVVAANGKYVVDERDTDIILAYPGQIGAHPQLLICLVHVDAGHHGAVLRTDRHRAAELVVKHIEQAVHLSMQREERMRFSRCHFLPIHHRRQEIVGNRRAILGAKRNQQLKIRICCVMDSLSDPIRTNCLSQSRRSTACRLQIGTASRSPGRFWSTSASSINEASGSACRKRDADTPTHFCH